MNLNTVPIPVMNNIAKTAIVDAIDVVLGNLRRNRSEAIKTTGDSVRKANHLIEGATEVERAITHLLTEIEEKVEWTSISSSRQPDKP